MTNPTHNTAAAMGIIADFKAAGLAVPGVAYTITSMCAAIFDAEPDEGPDPDLAYELHLETRNERYRAEVDEDLRRHGEPGL